MNLKVEGVEIKHLIGCRDNELCHNELLQMHNEAKAKTDAESMKNEIESNTTTKVFVIA